MHVQASFSAAIRRLQELPYSPLDISQKRWPADMAAFLATVRELETSLAAAMQAALDRAGPLTARMQLLKAGS